MKNLLVIFSILYLSTGCALFNPSGAASRNEAKNRNKIVNLDSQISSNAFQKLDNIAGLAYGVNYSLNKVNDPPREMTVALDLNQRIMSLSGSPSIEAMKDMQLTIDKLTSDLEKERNVGKKMLNEKDKEISANQNQTKTLMAEKDTLIAHYMKDAKEAAANADAYKVELDKMDEWFGLGAVWYGVKKFVTSSLWVIGIGSLLFFILRIASMSNPIAASIFSIFNMIGSWIINVIKVIVPKAVDIAGHVTTDAFNAYKSTLTKIVDAIQSAKTTAIAAGKEPNLEDVLDQVAKSMNEDEKAIVTEIKKALHWKT